MIEAFTARRRARKLLALMNQERALLLAGRLGDLAQLCAQRDLAFQSLAGSDSIMAEIAPQLRALAQRNCRLLRAAIDGLHAGQKLVDHANANAGGIQTYTALGKRVVVPSSQGESTHRA